MEEQSVKKNDDRLLSVCRWARMLIVFSMIAFPVICLADVAILWICNIVFKGADAHQIMAILELPILCDVALFVGSTFVWLITVLITIQFSLRTLMSYVLGVGFSVALIVTGLPLAPIGVFLLMLLVVLFLFYLRDLDPSRKINIKRDYWRHWKAKDRAERNESGSSQDTVERNEKRI